MQNDLGRRTEVLTNALQSDAPRAERSFAQPGHASWLRSHRPSDKNAQRVAAGAPPADKKPSAWRRAHRLPTTSPAQVLLRACAGWRTGCRPAGCKSARPATSRKPALITKGGADERAGPGIPFERRARAQPASARWPTAAALWESRLADPEGGKFPAGAETPTGPKRWG